MLKALLFCCRLTACAVVWLGVWGAPIATAQSQSYVNSSDTYNWIDPSTHNRIRAYSATYTYPGISNPIPFPRTGPPYFFYTPTGSSCGTSGTTIDDRLSDAIPIGFTFNFAGLPFTTVRVNTNGRIQFNNVTCGSGTDGGAPTIYTYDYPDANMNYTMRIYGADLDPTPKNFKDGLVSTAVNAGYATVCLDDAQCFVSIATIGVAPTRKFVVTWNNVPKWVNAGLIAGNFNLQIILEEGGDFVYQFGNVADSQPGVPAQIGWQVNANDYDIKQTALPTNNSAIRYQIPRPLVRYQMEQASWTSAPGQVVDSSGNNTPGTRLGAVQTTASGYACIGANIPANTSAATFDAINTNVNLNGLGGVGSMTFWYKPSAWSGAGAVSAQLLDASNASNAWFYLSKRMSGTGAILRFAVRDDTGTTRAVETAAMTNSVLSATGWVHIAVSWNFNTLAGTLQDRLRIYVNGSAIGSGNSVQSTFTTAGAPIAGIDTLYIGDNRSSFVDGTNGSGNSANGVIDEFRLYNLEAGYGQVLTDKGAATSCANHYAITHAGSTSPPGNGTTCLANPVTITMHTASDTPIASSSTITLSTSTGKGDWTLTGGYGVLTNGAANDGIATYRFNNESQVVLALTHTTAATVNINVTDGSFAELPGATEDANLVVDFCANPGFNGCEYTGARCTPGATDYDQLFTKLAGRAFKLDAVALTIGGAVETTFNGPVTIDLLANASPTAINVGTNCPVAQTAVIPLGTATFASGRLPGTGLTVAATALSSVSPNYSAYRDVRMRFTCSVANCPPSGTTICSRDAFAIRPTDLTLTASSMTNTSVTGGTPKLTAGTQFPMAAQAVTAANGFALGYNGTPQITATVAAQSVSAQNSATVTLTDYTDRLKDANVNATTLFNSASASTGLANASFYYLDYGGFRVLANGAKDSDFVSPSIDVPGKDCVAGSSSNTDSDADPDREKFGCTIANQSNSALVGRFYPATFLLASSALTQGCVAGAFTYEGQGLGIAASVNAMSSGTVIAAAVMPHYVAGTVTLGAENNNNGTNLSTRLALNQSPTPAWANGSYAIAAPAATFSRSAAAPDGPFDALDIGVTVTDPDAVATLGAARNMLPTNATTCTAATCTHQKLAGSPIRMRYGRLRMGNVYGSERLDLPVPLEAQYWFGTTFARNTLDNCSTVTAANVSLVNHLSPVTAANVTVSGVANGGVLVNGLGAITLGRPSPLPNPWANIGSVDLVLNLGASGATVTCPLATPTNPLGASISANLAHLANNSCAAAAYDRNPTSRASLGVYKSPLIYSRENY